MGLKEVRKGSIAFLMPCGGPVEPRAVQSLLNMVSKAAIDGYPISFVGVTDRTLIHCARNWLSAGFLEDTDCEWAFWADSDMTFEPRTITVMMKWAAKLKAKMLTGVYYQRMGKHGPTIWRKQLKGEGGHVLRESPDDYGHFPVYPGVSEPDGTVKVCPGGAPFRVDVAGFGCVLVHRDVFSDLKRPYFKFNFYEDSKGNQKESSEDYHFFVEAKKAGHALWAVPELELGHIGQAPIVTYRDCELRDPSKVVSEVR